MAIKKDNDKPYALEAGQGWTYRTDADFTVKTSETKKGHGAAVMEYMARKGEEPEKHIHKTEDEMFYVLEGSLTFHCGEQDFEVKKNGFIFLPRGIEHGYTVRSKEARLLTITSPVRRSPKEGWGGIIGEIESAKKKLVAQPPAG